MSSGFRFLPLLVLAAVLSCAARPALADPQGTGVNYETRLESIEEQMRTMNGRLEQLEFSLKRIDQAMQRMQADTDQRLQRLETAPAPAAMQQPSVVVPPAGSNLSSAANMPATIYNAPAAAAETPPPGGTTAGTLGSIKMQDGHVTGVTNSPSAPPLPQTPPDYGLTPQEQYDRAFEMLRNADYDEAGDAFQEFITKNPQDKLVDNAKYWYGETLYVRGKYDQSAAAFGDAYSQNPQGNKAPDSLLKLAMSLEKLNKNQDACVTLESVKGKYPHASAKTRQQTDQEYAKLKCASATPPAH